MLCMVSFFKKKFWKQEFFPTLTKKNPKKMNHSQETPKPYSKTSTEIMDM